MLKNRGDREYWALQNGEDLGKGLATRVEDYLDNTCIGARNTLIRRAYMYYYSLDADSGTHGGSTVLRGGEQGELAKIRVNHARALIKTQLNLVTSQRFTWDPKAVNEDSESLKEVRKASQLLEFYWRELGIEQTALQVAENALGPGAGEAFAHVTWNPFGGDEFLPDEQGNPLMSGDVDVHFVPTWDVIRDPTVTGFKDSNWLIIRRWLNKFDVAEQYAPMRTNPITGEETSNPLRDAILDQPKTKDFRTGPKVFKDTDQLEVFYFYHKRTASVRKGREVVFLADGTLLTKPRGLYSTKPPVIRMAAGEIVGTPFPYAPYLEIIGIQELMDSLNTVVASNQTTFGTQYIAVQEGSEFSPEDFASGLRLLNVPDMAHPPQALQLTKSPPEVFNYLDKLQAQQELLVGLNNIVRGQAQSGDQSGSSQALLASQALQNASDIQLAWVTFLTELGDCVFTTLNTFLSAPRQIAIVGQANRSLVEPFEMERGAFKQIKRIQIELGNILMQSPAARQETATMLIQMGLVKSIEQYQTLMDSGRLEPLTRKVGDELILIADENEKLQSGEAPPVLVLDDHMLHAREHATLLASTLARKDPGLIQRVLAHIQEHEAQYFTAPPQLLMMTGQQPPPPPVAPMAPVEGEPAGEAPPAEPAQSPGNPVAGAMPTQPTNPLTGAEYDLVTGGGIK